MSLNHVEFFLTTDFFRHNDTCNFTMKDQPNINVALLMQELGPAPTVAQTARFLRESTVTTWRRIKNRQIQTLKGDGIIRISLKSIAEFLNGGCDYELTHKRGKRKATL
jgi:hypothetical protein